MQVVDCFARARAPWTGTSTALLGELNAAAGAEAQASPGWPQTAQALGNTLDRLQPHLKARGVIFSRRHSGIRTITIALVEM